MYKFAVVILCVSFSLACIKAILLYSTLSEEQHQMIANGESQALSHSFRFSQSFLYASGYMNVVVSLISGGVLVIYSILDMFN